MSRDRGKDYARAVTRAAPQALQVVDRFHLVRNLAEVLQKVLAHCRTEIRQPEADLLLAEQRREHPARLLPPPAAWQQRTPPHIEVAHRARQASRDDRFRQMMALRAHGLTQAAIAKRMGMSEKAVRNWLKRVLPPPGSASSAVAAGQGPYATYVLERWQEGVHEAKQLYEEIRGQGFPGTVRIVQRFVQALTNEPTVHLDAITERAVLDTLRGMRQNHTIVMVTHRLAELDMCDEILVLHEGRIAERGTHENLLGARGYYWRMQMEQQTFSVE